MIQNIYIDGEGPSNFYVVSQKSFMYDAITIQITKVLDLRPESIQFKGNYAEVEYRYIYEEISNDTDMVEYSRFMGKDNIDRNYKWAVGM